MKQHSTKLNVGTPVRGDLEVKEVEPIEPEEQEGSAAEVETKPGIYGVKCIWSGPVKVTMAPSGKAYSFSPQEEQRINEADALYLVSLGQDKPGCCTGSGTPRRYFELV